MPSEPSSKFPYGLLIAALNAVLLFFALLFIVIELPARLSAEKTTLAASLQPSTNPSNSLSAVPVKKMPDGTEIYDVTCNVMARNQSSHPVRITYAITELYLGEAQPPAMGPEHAYELNGPPNPWDKGPFPGAIRWRRVLADAYEIDGGAPASVERFLKTYGKVTPGGPMTGIVSPGGSAGESPHFMVQAKPGEYVAVVVGYGIGGAVKSPNALINRSSDMKKLPDEPARVASR